MAVSVSTCLETRRALKELPRATEIMLPVCWSRITTKSVVSARNYYLHQRRLQGPLKDRIALLIEAGYATRAPNCSTSITPLEIKRMLWIIGTSSQNASAAAELRDVAEPNSAVDRVLSPMRDVAATEASNGTEQPISHSPVGSKVNEIWGI